tara:strand:- start:130 stop:336 length:207 start_codon:yes stop_codon:yes gene_type:complete
VGSCRIVANQLRNFLENVQGVPKRTLVLTGRTYTGLLGKRKKLGHHVFDVLTVVRTLLGPRHVIANAG